MEENQDVNVNNVNANTKKKNKKLLVIVSIVVGVMVVAGVGLAATLVKMNADKAAKEKVGKPKLVAPVKIMTTIKTANDSAKAAYDAHTKAQAALNEQPVKLVK